MALLEDLLSRASKLPEDQKLTLAHRLLVAAEPEASESVGQAWDTEIREKIARYDRGEARTRPVEEVFAALDKSLHE